MKRSRLFSSTNESELVGVVAKAQKDFSKQRRYWWHALHPKYMYNIVESDENLKTTLLADLVQTFSVKTSHF